MLAAFPHHAVHTVERRIAGLDEPRMAQELAVTRIGTEEPLGIGRRQPEDAVRLEGAVAFPEQGGCAFPRDVLDHVLAEDRAAASGRERKALSQVPDHVDGGAAGGVDVHESGKGPMAATEIHAEPARGKAGKGDPRSPAGRPVVIRRRPSVGAVAADETDHGPLRGLEAATHRRVSRVRAARPRSRAPRR
jgi:hypothetical protein